MEVSVTVNSETRTNVAHHISTKLQEVRRKSQTKVKRKEKDWKKNVWQCICKNLRDKTRSIRDLNTKVITKYIDHFVAVNFLILCITFFIPLQINNEIENNNYKKRWMIWPPAAVHQWWEWSKMNRERERDCRMNIWRLLEV